MPGLSFECLLLRQIRNGLLRRDESAAFVGVGDHGRAVLQRLAGLIGPLLVEDHLAQEAAVQGVVLDSEAFDARLGPSGAKLERRAIQLGMRGDVLEAFGQRELLEVIDLTEFVAEQRANASASGLSALLTPTERVYAPADAAVVRRLGLSVG